MDSQKMKQLILKGIKGLIRPIIIITIIIILLVSLFFGVIDGIYENVAKIFNDIVDNINIEGNNIVIDEEYMENAKSRLERLGINSSTLGLGNDEKYLERYLEAEIVTNYPYLGGDGLQGAVYFERAKVDGTTTRLSYLEYNDFYNRVNNGEDVNDYFTVDQEDWTVHVMKIDGSIEKINYKNMVEKFAMPFEFPIALAMTSQNPQFALAVVDLVEDSRIIITIAESSTTTTRTVTEHYDEKVEQTIYKEDGTKEESVLSEGEKSGEPQVTTETTYSTNIFLSSARTWILNEITDLKYDESSEDLEPQEETINPVITSTTEQVDENTSVRTTKSNRKNIINVHYDYKRWLRGTSKVIEKSENFTKLIINDGATNGNGFVQIAKELHDYLVEYQYYYSSRPNVTAGRFVQDSEAIASRRPTFGEPMSQRYLCCTTFTAWVLETAGYEGIAYGSLELLDNSIKDRGWELIEDVEDVEPGDMCFWYQAGTTDLKHTNVCASKEPDGTLRFYDAGCTDAIRTLEPILYVDNMGSIRHFAYAYRPNDKIARALGANSIEELKEDIEDFIDVSVTEGEYSVRVVNLDNTSDSITINNKRVKSNGLIKLFIMASAYSEVRNGNIKEEDITADLERMITTDSNTSANSLLKTMGNGDIAKGVDKVNEYARQNGYANTKLEGELDQDNLTTEGNEQTYTSVRDVDTILQKIYDGTCVNQEYAEKMMNILKGQLNTEMIPSTITNAQIASKSGEQNGIVQDSAIIATENSNYLLVISASEITNVDNAKNNIREIANMVNLYFEKHPTTDENENYKKDDEIETRMNGDRVCYRLTSGEFQCPLNNLVESREMLFELLGKYEKTQSHERLMRYLLYLLTGNDYGVTEFDFNEFLNGAFYGVGGLVGSTPEEKVWWALRDAGYSKEAAAGAMGNIYAESGFDPAVIEGGNGIGFGLCQWSFGRRTQLESYAASKGVSPSDLDTQIEFLIGELTPGGGANGYATYQLVSYKGYSASSWKNAGSPEDAAVAFCWSFERPGIPRMDVRTSAARRYYEQFKDAERPSNGAAGSLVQAADNVARYLIDNSYTYKGTGSANYTFPIANSGLRTLSCSSYVQECLLQAGYSGAAGGEKLWARGENVSAAISDFRNMGINVQLIEDMSALQPGDIIQFRSPWPGGYHVAIVYNVSGGNVQYKGVAEVMNPAVGNNRSNGAVGFDGRTKPFSYYQTYRCYALRITN